MHRLVNNVALIAVLLHLLGGCSCHGAHGGSFEGEHQAAASHESDRPDHGQPAEPGQRGDDAPGEPTGSPACCCETCHIFVPGRNLVIASHPDDTLPTAVYYAHTGQLPLRRAHSFRDGPAIFGYPPAGLYLLNRALLL